MLEALVPRILEGLTHFASIVIPHVRIRFQLAPGTEAGLGISGVPYEVFLNGASIATGTTDANGEVVVPTLPAGGGNAVLKIFGTEYNINLLNSWDAENTTIGQQQRLDQLGFIHGYQLSAVTDPPSDGTLTPRFHDAINNIQWEKNLKVDGTTTATTTGPLKTDAGA